MFLGSVVNKLGSSVRRALSQYAVGTNEPELALNFIDNEYKTNNSTSTFASAITHSRSGNAVMVDSSGYLKWAPHNLIVDSDDLTGLGSISGVTRTATTLTETTGTGSHTINIGYIPIVGEKYTLACEVKLESGTRFVSFRGFGEGGANKYPIFNLVNGTIEDSGTSFTDVSITDVGGGYYLLKASVITSSAFSWAFHLQDSTTSGSDGYSYTGDGTSAVAIRKIRQYRSELGGMVDNPDKSGNDVDFVPTTGTIAYLPRVGHHIYNGNAWVNEGLLAESESRTNLIDYSDFSTNWATTNATKTDDDATGPDGETSAIKLEGNSTVAAHNIKRGATSVNASSNYTFSVFAKKGTHDALGLRMDKDNSGAAWANFDLTNGYVKTGGGGTAADDATIEDMGNGWFRCAVTDSTDSSDTTINPHIHLMDDYASPATAWDASGKDVYLYGAQLEEAYTPSSFIPTIGSSVTRAAETFTIPSANLTWNDNHVSIAIDGRVTYADEDQTNTATVYDWSEDSDNRIYARIRTDAAKTGQYQALQEESGTTTGRASDADYLTPGIFVPFNVAARHGSTFINLALDGEDVGESTAPTALPDLSSTDLDLADDYMGTIGTFRIWDRDLTDEGIEEATNPSLEPSLSLTFEGTGTNSFVVNDWSE